MKNLANPARFFYGFDLFAQLCGHGLEPRASPVIPNARTSGGYIT